MAKKPEVILPLSGSFPEAGASRVVEATGSIDIGIQLSGVAVVTVHAPIPRDHPHLAHIGRIAVEWAAIEHMLDTIIWRLANVAPNVGACLTAQMIGIRPRFLTIIALSTQQRFPKNLIRKVDATMNDGVTLGERRNRALHDPWYLERVGQTPAQLRAMPAKELIYGFKPMPKAELNRGLAAITNYAGDVESPRMTILAEVSSRKEPGRS